MTDLNSVLVEGNLTRDPVLNTTSGGRSVCSFAVATHRKRSREEQSDSDTSFFDVEVWARQAETCAEFLRKGRGVRVVGRLKQDRWKDPEGRPRSKVKIVAEHVEFRPMRRKPEEGEDVEASSEEAVSAPAAVEVAEEELAVI